MKTSLWVGILSSIMIFRGFGELLIPPDSCVKLIERKILSEIGNEPGVNASRPNHLERVACYTGATFGVSGIIYEIFPALGFFRMQSYGPEDSSDWIYIRLKVKDARECIMRSENGSVTLQQHLSDKLLLCGSGLLRDDITSERYSCKSIDHYVLISRKIGKSGYADEFRFLVDATKGGWPIECISFYSFWKGDTKAEGKPDK